MYSPADLKKLDEKSISYNDEMYTEYEAEQKMRYYERKIRDTRRELAAYDEAVKCTDDDILKKQLKDDFTKASVKLKNQEAKLNDFCNQTGLLKDSARIQTHGFGKSTSQKAVWANKKAVDKSAKSGIIKSKNNYSKITDLLNFEEIPDKTIITPTAIIDDLLTSKKGRNILNLLDNLPEKPKINYTDSPEGVKAEENHGVITIYVKNCKDVKTATCALIHEYTHYQYGIGNSQWAECVCVSQELLHRRNRNYLTYGELKMVVKAVKQVYPEFNWRKGGLIYGRRKTK